MDTEFIGGEHLLAKQCKNEEVARKMLFFVDRMEQRAKATGADMRGGQPTPGNIKGGLTTIEEKSLGAIAKAGTTDLREVYGYAEPVTARGFVFMDTPGYDPVGATGQVAGGANLLCFTTGRGSVFGMKPAPSIKLATNTPMYERLSEDMDINCGLIVDGECSVAEMGQRIFEQILRHASGEPTKSEQLGLGDNEFVPWHLGIVS